MKAPFPKKIVQHLNHYQRRNKQPFKCSCGERLYADTEGLHCPDCLTTISEVEDQILEWKEGSWDEF